MTHIEQMIKDMCPNGVECKYLTDVANVLYGYPFEAEKFSEDESNIPLIRIRDVVPAKASTYYTGTYPKEYIIKAGDILVGMDGNFNLEKWKDRNGLLNQRVCKIYSKNSDAVLDNFLYHLLKPLFKKIEDEIKGGTVKHLSAARIKQIEIPIPPLEIQKKIVEFLDKFSALAAELQAELQMRRKQYEYYRTHLLTPHSDCNSAGDSTDDCNWEWKTLGEICKFQNGFAFQSSKFSAFGKPILRITNIKDSQIDDSCLVYFDEEDYKVNLEPYKVLPNRIVIAMSGATTGKVGMNCSEQVYYMNQRVGMFIPNESLIDNNYLFHFLSSQTETLYYLAGGGAQPNLSTKAINELPILLPSLAEQKHIAELLDKLSALTTSLSDGIPAEQAAQQKRYEYYRDLLLTFPRKAV